jgi:hypothetical protein
MKIRAMDTNSDWCYGLGKQNYKDNILSLEQNLITRIRSWKNDCFFDLEAGIDWNNLIGDKNLNDLKKSISQVILGTDGVIGITNFSTSNDSRTRELTMTINIDTIYGAINLRETGA